MKNNIRANAHARGYDVCVLVHLCLVTVLRIKARRVFRFAVFSGDYYTLQRIFFCPSETNRGHTGAQEGVNTGAFSFFLFSFHAPRPTPSCSACLHLHFFIARRVRVQPSLSLVGMDSNFRT